MKKSFTALIIILLSVFSTAQIPEDKLKAIDTLFLEWDRPNHPGGTVGISVHGIPVFSQAYGLASMEYQVPVSYGTRFNIASVSKQFTAMGIVKLHLEGKLSIDDDIRKYLPELPDFGHKITFRHMLHHTSGLRSLHTLLALAGWRDDDMKNNDDLLRFMTRQQDLNFEPGSEYMYCNTGYILCAIIIEKITGESFAEWMEREIFKPLCLYDTYVEDKYNRITRNYATSYNGSYNNGFVKEIEYWAYTGSGNIHSTAADLLKWMKYYYDSPEGWEEEFSMMLTLDAFNNGEPNDYAFGVRIDKYRDEKRISHSGSIGGFRSYACTFPEHETEIAILTNFSSSDVSGKINNIADILFDKEKEEEPGYNFIKKEIDNRIINRYIGAYKSEDLPDRLFEIFRKEDTLYCKSTGGRDIRLYAASDSVLFNNNRRLKISLADTVPETIIISSNDTRFSWIKTEKYIPDAKELQDIAGNYWSSELETQYRFYVKDGDLYGYQTRHGEFAMECIDKDVYVSNSGFINKITIERKRRKITGMKVSNSRVRNLWLERIPL